MCFCVCLIVHICFVYVLCILYVYCMYVSEGVFV